MEIQHWLGAIVVGGAIGWAVPQVAYRLARRPRRVRRDGTSVTAVRDEAPDRA